MSGSPLKLAVFAYNFPHKKTQDVLLRLFLEGCRVTDVIACDPVKLSIPPASIRTKVRHTALVHPRIVAERLGAAYHVLGHNSPEAVELAQRSEFDLAIIAGARILKRPIIDQFPLGVINFHPGLIPESRGLDAMLWSIRNDIPLGVTAHLIDHRIDAGRVLLRQEIPLQADDTVFDLAERLMETQLDMLAPAIEAARAGRGNPVGESTEYNRKMEADVEAETLAALPDYLRRRTAGA